MRDAKTVLLKRLAKQSQAALACCGELAKTAREIAKTSAQLSALPGENFTANEVGFVEATGQRIAAIRAAIDAAAEGSN